MADSGRAGDLRPAAIDALRGDLLALAAGWEADAAQHWIGGRQPRNDLDLERRGYAEGLQRAAQMARDRAGSLPASPGAPQTVEQDSGGLQEGQRGSEDEGLPPAERELLDQAEVVLHSLSLRLLGVSPRLKEPYTDAPELSPWTRTVGPLARRAHDTAMAIRKHLGLPHRWATSGLGTPPLEIGDVIADAWRDGYGQGRDDEAGNLPLREAPGG